MMKRVYLWAFFYVLAHGQGAFAEDSSFKKESTCFRKGGQDVSKENLLRSRNHVELINYLIKTRGYTTYLEIGVADGFCLSKVCAAHKVGVDPNQSSPCTYHMTSDAYFAKNKKKFDIIFIDGLHLYEQVLRDVNNALSCLNPGGTIVMHDCLPEERREQERVVTPGPWLGDVWKAAATIRMVKDTVRLCVIDMDWGCGVLIPKKSKKLLPRVSFEELTWDYYCSHRNELLNVVSLEQWLSKN